MYETNAENDQLYFKNFKQASEWPHFRLIDFRLNWQYTENNFENWVFTELLLETEIFSQHPDEFKTPRQDKFYMQYSKSYDFRNKLTKINQHARITVNFKEVITKCSNEMKNKLTSTRQHNKYLLGHIGYMFRLVNRSSSGLQYNI